MVEVCDRTTMHLLVKDKLPLLSTIARAALVDGLQKLGLRYRPRRQTWVRDVIISTHGLDLTHFKAYIDDGGDYHTMYKLVYNDLQGELQKEVLAHLKREGEAVAAVVAGSGPGAPPGAVLKVLSDIDDTVFSSGDSFPAGVDCRYPRKCFYPGALALYAALDRCFAQKHAALLQMVATVGVIAAAEESEGGSSDSDEEVTSPAGGNNNSNAPAKTEEQRESPGSDSLPSPPPLPPVSVSTTSRPTNTSHLLSTTSAAVAAASMGRDSPSASPFVIAAGAVRLRLPSADVITTPRDPGPLIDVFSPRAADSPLPERRHHAAFIHHQEGSNLVFLSARPESYKGLTESESYRKYFQPPLLRGELDTSPTMLLGSLDSGPRALMKLVAGHWLWAPDDSNPRTAAAALYQTLAAKKLSRFREYATVYPEAAFIFVGDNGQGDVLCAEILTSTASQHAAPKPSQLLASFIHRVIPPGSTLSMLRTSKGTKEDWLVSWQQRRIYFHRTHVGMANEAFRLGLLDDEGLHAVMSTAVVDFRRIVGRYGGRHAGRNLEKGARHLNKDIEGANAKLPHELRVPLVEIPGVGDDMCVPGGSVRAASVALSDVTGLQPMR